jgi:drug/metabolite transporter (DMT)-like permease
MSLDLRVPIGLLFGLIGALLTIYGLFSDPAIYQASLGINVNLWWGLVLMLFGGAMLGSAWVTARKTASEVGSRR